MTLCPTCGAPLPPNPTAKQLKQHQKSLVHKRGGHTTASADRTDERGGDEDEDEELAALRALPGLEVAPTELLRPYAVNRRRYRALCPDAPDDALLLPPPVLRSPSRECPQLDRPFLTPRCGSIPTVPRSLDEAIGTYFEARKESHPRVHVDEVDQDVSSWVEARRALQAAAAAGRRFWCTFFQPGMGHPAWYPKACKGPDGFGEGPGSAPTQDQIINGRGRRARRGARAVTTVPVTSDRDRESVTRQGS